MFKLQLARILAMPMHNYAAVQKMPMLRSKTVRNVYAKPRQVTPNHNAKLTIKDVLTIHASRHLTQRVLAARYGVSKDTIAHIQHERTWKFLFRPEASTLTNGPTQGRLSLGEEEIVGVSGAN